VVDQDKDTAADNDRHNDERHYARRKLISLKMIRHWRPAKLDWQPILVSYWRN
jgi:hypothetical protein